MIEAVEQNEHALEYRASEHKTDNESLHEAMKEKGYAHMLRTHFFFIERYQGR